jgi:hypothetical protein
LVLVNDNRVVAASDLDKRPVRVLVHNYLAHWVVLVGPRLVAMWIFQQQVGLNQSRFAGFPSHRMIQLRLSAVG